jgi:glycosyltransferase involved in cell wall biosynthesis
MSKPKLAIVLITYKRTEYTLRTIQGVVDNMDYPRMWYVADDGSPEEHMEAVIGLLRKNDEEIIGQHNHRYSPNCGVGFNWAIKNCLEHSDYVMFLEDDWVLSGNYDMNETVHPGKFNINPYIRNGRFNPTPYMELLAEREDVGMVRLGGIAVGNTVELVGHSGHHYLKYLREQQYAYSGNPHIRHRRFMDAYGYFSEKKLNPGELELEFDGRFRAASGPDIWRPYDIPGWGIFFHIGEARYR